MSGDVADPHGESIQDPTACYVSCLRKQALSIYIPSLPSLQPTRRQQLLVMLKMQTRITSPETSASTTHRTSKSSSCLP